MAGWRISAWSFPTSLPRPTSAPVRGSRDLDTSSGSGRASWQHAPSCRVLTGGTERQPIRSGRFPTRKRSVTIFGAMEYIQPMYRVDTSSRYSDSKRADGRHDMENGTRDDLLRSLAKAIGSVAVAHPTRVAIDGRPAAGKPRWPTSWPSSCVRRAATSSARRSRTSLLPDRQRYRRGEYSAEGCYHDGTDVDALHRVLLDPLGPGGDPRFQRAVYDKVTDTARSDPFATAPADAVLLFDGVFLMRSELIGRWDVCHFRIGHVREDLASRPDS